MKRAKRMTRAQKIELYGPRPTPPKKKRVEPDPIEDDDGQPDEMQEWHDFDPDC